MKFNKNIVYYILIVVVTSLLCGYLNVWQHPWNFVPYFIIAFVLNFSTFYFLAKR
jgi:hypothetical protein